MSNKIKELAKHFFVYGFGSIAQSVTGFVLLPIITRHLIPSDYGTYTLINMAGLTAGTFFYLGITSALPRSYFDYKDETERNHVLSTALILILFGALLQIIAGLLFGETISLNFVGTKEFSTYVSVMFLAAAVAFINTFFQMYFRLLNKSKVVVSQGLIASFLNFFVAIFLFKATPLTIWVPILSFLISQLIICLASLWLVHDKISFYINKHEAKLMLKFGYPTILTSLTIMALEWSDRFFLNKFLSLSDVGIYSLAYKFGTLINPLLVAPFSQIWNPLMMKYKDSDDIQSLSRNVLTYYFMVGSLFALAASCYFKELIYFFVKNAEYHKGVTIIPIIMAGILFYGANNILTAGFIYSRKVMEITYICAVFALVSIGLNYSLIPKFGYYGAALSCVTTYTLLPIAIYLRSRKYFDINVNLKTILLLILTNGLLIVLTQSITFPGLIERVLIKTGLLILGCITSLVIVFGKESLAYFTHPKKGITYLKMKVSNLL